MHVRISWKLSLSPLADIWAALLSCSWWKSLCSPKYLRGVGEKPVALQHPDQVQTMGTDQVLHSRLSQVWGGDSYQASQKDFGLSFSCCCSSSTTLIVNTEDNM